MPPTCETSKLLNLFGWLQHAIFYTDTPDLDDGFVARRCDFTYLPNGASLVQILHDFLAFLFVEELMLIFIASFGSAKFTTPLDIYHSAHHSAFLDVFQFHFVQAGHD